MYAVIRNSFSSPGSYDRAGHAESRHYSALAAFKAVDKAQRAFKRANGPATHLDLTVIEVAWDNGDVARGPVQCRLDHDPECAL